MNRENNREEIDNTDLNDAQLQDIVNNKDVAASSYFLLLSPILLLTRKDSDFIQHHAHQALVLFFIFVFLWFLGGIHVFFAWLTIGVFFIALVSFIQAINGKYYKIPYIYDFVKDGFSVALFVSTAKNVWIAVKEMAIGLFPKNSFSNDEKLEKTIETHEKKGSESEEREILQKLEKVGKKVEILEKRIIQLETSS